MQGFKTCTRCEIAKSLCSDFYMLTNGKPMSWCKGCVRERQKARKADFDDVTPRECRRCKKKHLRKHFTGRANICDFCKEAGHKNLYHSLSKEERTRKNRSESLRKMYKLSEPEFDKLSAEGCAVCGTMDSLCVDHDHRCCPGKYTCGRCVRGVLCAKHNKGEGAFESIKEIENLLSYRIKFEEIGVD